MKLCRDKAEQFRATIEVHGNIPVKRRKPFCVASKRLKRPLQKFKMCFKIKKNLGIGYM